jgi:anti-sigma factor RsiW
MSAYIDGDLRERARARLEHHVRECEQCRRLLGDLRRMLGLLAQAGHAAAGAPSAQIAAQVRARLHGSRGERPGEA